MHIFNEILDWIIVGLKDISIKEFAIFLGALVTVQTARNKIKFDLASKQIDLCDQFLREYYYLRKIHPHEVFKRIMSEYESLNNERKNLHIRHNIYSKDHSYLKESKDKLSTMNYQHLTPESYDYLISYLQEYENLLKITAQLNDNIKLEDSDLNKLLKSASLLDLSIYPRISNIAKRTERKKTEYITMLEKVTQSIFETYTNKFSNLFRARKNKKRIRKTVNTFTNDIIKEKNL